MSPQLKHSNGKKFWKLFTQSGGLGFQGVPGGTKTDRDSALCGSSGLSWERKYYDSN